MYEPSGRPYSLAWRTMTALTTSPFLTEPPGVASLTEATITSPIEASNFDPPATTRMHISSRAPVLSATRSLVCGMITKVPSGGHRGPQATLEIPRSRLYLSYLHRLPGTAAENLLDHPVLVFADRTGLGDQHRISDLTAIGLIMSFEMAGAPQRPPIQTMAGHHLDRHHN